MSDLQIVQYKGPRGTYYKQLKHCVAEGTYHKVGSIPAEGSPPSTILTDSSDIVNFYIPQGAYGRVIKAFIEVTATVATAAVTLSSSDQWISLVQFMKDNSDMEVQRFYPASIREYMSNLPQEEFLYWMQFMNSTADFKPDPSPVQVGTKTFVIPLLSSYLEDLYLKAIGHSIKIVCTFQNALISGSAANLSVPNSGLRLVLFYEDLPMKIGKQLTDMYSKGYAQDYLSVLNWNTTQSFSPASTYQFKLDSIIGKVVYLWWCLRANPTTASGATVYQQIGDSVAQGQFNLLDSANNLIYGVNQDNTMLSLWEPSNHFKGELPLFDRGVNRFFLGGDMDKAWTQDSYMGWYPFTGNEQVWFTTAANNVEQSRVVTVTPYIGTTATTPTAGSFQLVYNIPECPGSRRSFISAPIAFGATSTQINTAISNMLIPDIAVTCTASTMTSAGLVLTISGISVSKDYHTAYRGAEWSCISGLTTGTAAVTTTVVDTTASVPSSGFSTATTYRLDVYALVLREIVIKNNRIGQFITV